MSEYPGPKIIHEDSEATPGARRLQVSPVTDAAGDGAVMGVWLRRERYGLLDVETEFDPETNEPRECQRYGWYHTQTYRLFPDEIGLLADILDAYRPRAIADGDGDGEGGEADE